MLRKNIVVPEELLEQFEEICEKKGKTFSQLVREIIEEHIERYNSKEAIDPIEQIVSIKINYEIEKVQRRFIAILTKFAVIAKSNELLNKIILDNLNISDIVNLSKEELLLNTLKELNE